MHLADPQSLRLFIAVCECGTIARAAEREFIAPSALSKRLSDLEDLLGVALLTRSQRGVTPTPAGESLLARAHPVLRSLQRMQADVAQHAQGIRGHVRMLSIRAAVAGGLHQDLSAFLADHPFVGLTLDECASSEVMRGVSNGTAEIGICRAFEPSRELRAYPYGQDNLAAVVALSHPLADRKSINFVETLEFDQVCSGQANSHKAFTDKAAKEAGKTVKYRLFVSSPHAALSFISNGFALGIFPCEAIADVAKSYDLRVIPLNDEWSRRMRYICVSATEPLSPAARRLLQRLRSHYDPQALNAASN